MENEKTMNEKIEEEKTREKTPVDPMAFFTEEEVKKQDDEAKELMDAIRFGTPDFYDHLNDEYKNLGITGLILIYRETLLIKKLRQVERGVKCYKDQDPMDTIIDLLRGTLKMEELEDVKKDESV